MRTVRDYYIPRPGTVIELPKGHMILCAEFKPSSPWAEMRVFCLVDTDEKENERVRFTAIAQEHMAGLSDSARFITMQTLQDRSRWFWFCRPEP